MVGYRRQQNQGELLPLTRAPNQNWVHVEDWDAVMVQYDLSSEGCIPELVYAQMWRASLNSWYVEILTRDQFGFWTRRGINQGGTGGTTGMKSVQWGNPSRVRVWAVRFVAWTRYASIMRTDIS